MINARDIYHKLLLNALTLVATASHHGTGNFLQETFLRLMGVRVAGPVAFDRSVLIREPHNLQLGRYVSFGVNARLTCWDPVSIGDDFLGSDDLTINSGGHDPVTLAPVYRPIQIGARVWCGARVTICSGVTIGDDAIIGAGAVVVRSVAPSTVVAGVPARPVRTIARDLGDPPDRWRAGLWSNWPERCGIHSYRTRGAMGKFLLRLRNRV